MDNRFLTKVQSNLLDKIIIFSVSKKKKSFFSWNNWISIFKKELGSISLAPYTNINSKWIKDLNITPKFIKEENRKSFMTLALVMISIR